jgi:protein-S-isoprenylcysteine O-methyltransferase Ste14
MNRVSSGGPLPAALARYFAMGAVLAAVLLLVSGRYDWYRAWIYVLVLMGGQTAVGVALARHAPDLLRERSRVRENTKPWDRWMVALVGVVGPLAMWVTAALEARRCWPLPVPPVASAASVAVCLAGVVFTGRAMLANRFFATTVRIQEERGHQVVSAGPYAVVRHPGYSGALLFSLASPAALGSVWALLPAVLTAAVLVLRTALEDRTLQKELAGYAEYAARVRWRLAPGLW